MANVLSVPIITLSRASSKSSRVSCCLLWRAARIAASLTRFFKSAPEKPGVPAAISSKSMFSANGVFFECIFRMAFRSLRSGRSNVTWRSKRPGRSSAGSNTSGRLVADKTSTASRPEKPSSSAKIWLRVCSRSSCPPPRPVPRVRPTLSNSSMKIMLGAFFLAVSNRWRTREAPTPTNTSINSEPDIE